MDGDAELAGLVDQVLGDAGTGEGDDALGQEVEEVVVAAEGGGASVPVPVGLADDLVDAVALGPGGGDLLGSGTAAVDEDHVGVPGLDAIEGGPDGVGVLGLPAACDGDEGSVGEVGAGLAVLAGADEVAGVDGGGGELAGAAGVGAVAGPPLFAGLGPVGVGGEVAELLKGVAADALAASAAHGRDLATLLDPETPVPSVTQGPLRPEIAAIAVPTTTDGRNMAGGDFALATGWGHTGAGGAVMPGQGRAVERSYTPEECTTLGDALSALGQTTFDAHLNDRAFWRNVPAAVWHYRLGGYQVLKKWLSYRERAILGRPLSPEEVQSFADIARRTAAILAIVPPSREA